MSAFAPLTEVQFQLLGMVKARGCTWNAMADQLSLPRDVVERVPWLHEKQWDRTLAKAERLVAREAIAELGKTTTFVLDFVNETQEILEAFQTYYTTAELVNTADPNLTIAVATHCVT